MSEHTPIIDVAPIDHSSSRLRSGPDASSGDYGTRRPGSGREGSSRRESAWASTDHSRNGSAGRFGDAAAWTPASALTGLVQMAIGAGLVAIGIPMLILPGPGLLSIAAGGLLVARGASNLLPCFRR